MSDRDDTAEVGRTVAKLLYSCDIEYWPKSTIFSLREEELDASLRCTCVCGEETLFGVTSLGSEYSVRESLVEIDSIGELSPSRLLRREANLFSSIPEVVRAGFVFGAEIPFKPWLIVPTVNGEREEAETLS